jgi:hypothetical protein
MRQQQNHSHDLYIQQIVHIHTHTHMIHTHIFSLTQGQEVAIQQPKIYLYMMIQPSPVLTWHTKELQRVQKLLESMEQSLHSQDWHDWIPAHNPVCLRDGRKDT